MNPDDPRPSELDGVRVLIVEDDQLTAWGMQDILTDAGAIVAGIADTTEAASALLGAGRVDVATLDRSLGGVGTEALATELAAGGVPFVVVSGSDAPAEGGAVLVKPIRARDLVAALRTAIGRG